MNYPNESCRPWFCASGKQEVISKNRSRHLNYYRHSLYKFIYKAECCMSFKKREEFLFLKDFNQQGFSVFPDRSTASSHLLIFTQSCHSINSWLLVYNEPTSKQWFIPIALDLKKFYRLFYIWPVRVDSILMSDDERPT